MTLFFSTLFFLVFNDFFLFNYNIILILYFIYLLLYFFSKKSTLILPKKYFFEFFFYNSKFLLTFLVQRFLTVLSLFSFKNFKWKPLFKKSSYFGLYRSTRNQWLNK